MRFSFLLFIFYFSIGNCSACLNEYLAYLSGEIRNDDNHGYIPRKRIDLADKKAIRRALERADSLYQLGGSFINYSNYAYHLVLLGEYHKAKSIFLELASEHPNEYYIAANLGTTYELLGQVDSALVWIRKGLELNPHAHFGSEWIHAKILEGKIKAKKQASYFQSHSVLGLNFGSDVIPKSTKSKTYLLKIAHDINSQLSERMSFIHSKDAIIGQLLWDLANIQAVTDGDLQTAIQLIEMSKSYGFSSSVMDIRLDHFKQLQAAADLHGKWDRWIRAFVSLIFFSFVGLVSFFYLRTFYFILQRKKRLSSSQKTEY